MSGDDITLNAFDRSMIEQYFDEGYYLSAHPDIAAAGVDPLLHYHETGWHEGRNPSRTFNTLYYLRVHTDVAATGVNPLLHYALAGRLEGRVISRQLDAWRQRLENAPLASAMAVEDAQERLDNGRMHRTELLQLLRGKLGDQILVISVSHDDYAVSGGGVQNLIADEQKAAASLGWNYLHVAPVHHRMTLAPNVPAKAFAVSLRLNAEPVGQVDMEALLSVLVDLRHDVHRFEVVIHHMMAHAPELLLRLVQATGGRPPIVWAHDFFAACPSYTLLRNDVVFCGGPPPASPACHICFYGESRPAHLTRMRDFFATVQPVLLAPSKVALEYWQRSAGYPVSESAALPLARLLLAPSAHRRASADAKRPFRIAHIGTRDFHKGWPVFEELAAALRSDPRYQFYQFGRIAGPPLSSNIHQVPVTVTGSTRRAMIEAIARNRIDVVVSWSLWPETFCFAAYEAIAGGAFVLANRHAGNVPMMLSGDVAEHGLILEDRASLMKLFKDGGLVRRVAGSSRSRAALASGCGTIGWLQETLQMDHGPPATTGQEVRIPAHV